MIGDNIRFIRKQQNLTQQKFSDLIGIKRSSLGAYEEGRANPNYETLIIISKEFDISIDRLLKEDLAKTAGEMVFGTSKKERGERPPIPSGYKRNTPPPLAITLDSEGRENIELIPQKAEAGYLKGYSDLDYIKSLTKFRLPFLPDSATYRAFEIEGDSMLPLTSGSIVIGEYVEHVEDIKDGETYIVISENGIAYKRVFKRVGSLLMRSDNATHPEYSIKTEEVMELWKAKLFICHQDAFHSNTMSMPKLTEMVLDLQKEVIKLKDKV